MAAPRKLTYDDLWTFKDMGNVALSPDGRRVAFVMSSRDKGKNEIHSVIMLLHLDEQGQAIGEPRRLTSGTKHDSNPVWAPESRRLLFLSDREGDKNQLWLIDSDGGEAQQLTHMLHGVSEAAWSPDGRWIAFTAAAAPSDEDDILTGRKSLDEAARKKYEEEERIRLRSVTTIWYRLDGRGMFDKFIQLFVVPAPANDEAVDPAAIRRLTSDKVDYGQPGWTPDSQEISVLCNRAEDRDRSWVSDLWTIRPETSEARRISDGSLEIASYAWSPDGQRVLLTAARDMRKEGTGLLRPYLVSRGGGDLQALAADVDRDVVPVPGAFFGMPGPYHPQWSEDGRRVYLLVTDHGRINAHVLDIEQNTLTPLTEGERVVLWQALLPGEGGLLLAQSEPLHPWEFHLLPPGDTATKVPECQTHLYDGLMSEFTWNEAERIQYKGSNDDLIDGWLIRPVGAKEGVRYPLLVGIHGGPQGAFGCAIHPIYQYYAAQGFAVFYCNPHGSRGYGEAFMRQVEGDWGGWDFQDIMRGVDECIARGVADPERLVVTGYSYGGYMSMYIIGHTDRFKAAVPMAGVSNLVSFVGTSDLGFWMTLQSKGYPWDAERADYYRERSPLNSVSRVTTPTMFLHPENDLRCPIEQSEQFYMALRMMGKVPVEFVRVPAAWHIGTSKPSLFFARGEKMLDWFRKYVEIRPEEYA